MFNFKRPKAYDVDWPLLDSPVPIAIILFSYALFVFNWGKILMKDRKPFNVMKIMLVYNALQVIYNCILLYFCMKHVLIKPIYNFGCMESVPSDHPVKFVEQSITYAFFINKILDLADTIFFVLRKSYKQITLLHVYHHVGMALGGYLVVRFYGPGGHYCIMAVLNTFVHIVMYTYYFLSALSPRVREALWWKRYITIIQMLQFIIIFLHTLYVMVFSTDCGFPRIMLWVSLTQSATMLYMFTQFYVKTYMKPKQTITATATATTTQHVQVKQD